MKVAIDAPTQKAASDEGKRGQVRIAYDGPKEGILCAISSFSKSLGIDPLVQPDTATCFRPVVSDSACVRVSIGVGRSEPGLKLGLIIESGISASESPAGSFSLFDHVAAGDGTVDAAGAGSRMWLNAKHMRISAVSSHPPAQSLPFPSL